MQYMDMSQYDMIHTSCIMSSVTIMLLNNECGAANGKAEKEAKLLLRQSCYVCLSFN
jgi:hypothetical protein